MNNVARVLCQLVVEYHESVKSGGVECRVAIPGLTDSIAGQLHEALRAAGLPSFLIVPEGMQPSEADFRLRAEGLTSLRRGDMIIVAWPGELSRIQDSVIGAGGTIRNFAFTDDWPWLDDSNEYFQFHGPFVSALLDTWGASGPDREWLKTLIAGVLDSTQASVGRENLILDDVLSSFSPSLYPELVLLREKFLFHVGIPLPAEASNSPNWEADTLLAQYWSTSKLISDARLDINTRADVIERLRDIVPEETRFQQIEGEVQGLLDGLAENAEKQFGGLLVLRGCWGNGSLRWTALPLELLHQLFDRTAGSGNEIIVLQVRAQDELFSLEKKKAIVFENEPIGFAIKYSGVDPADVPSATIRIVQGNKELHSQKCQGIFDTIEVEVDFAEVFGNAARRRKIRIQLLVGQKVVAEQSVTLYPCGSKSPLLIVSRPKFDVYTAEENFEDGEDPAELIEVAAPISILAIINSPDRDVTVEINQSQVQLEADGREPRVLKFPTAIDPSNSVSGTVNIRAVSGNIGVLMNVEAAEFERGDFTLEREFVLRLSEGSATKVTQLISIFTGSAREPYAGLGGLNDATRARSVYAKAFEDPSSKGLPILGNLLHRPTDVVPEVKGWVGVCPGVDAGRLGKIDPAAGIQDLVEKYGAARRAVIDEVTNGLSLADDRWPKYAWYPVYVDRHRAKLEGLLVEYLNVYGEILQFLSVPAPGLKWEECFVLSALDCVVHWSNDVLDARAMLVGPWHPLVVAKRFMVQASLLASARRFVSKRPSSQSNRLVTLLDQVNSVRWMHMLDPSSISFGLGYVSSTSDPGWLLAISAQSLESDAVMQLILSLRNDLDLEVSMVPVARELMASSHLRNFQKAYPTRRAIALSASPIYSNDRIVESAEKILYDGEEPSSLGRMLPGGIHLFLDDSKVLPETAWRSPPVCIYSANTSSKWSDAYKDINLLPPGKSRVSSSNGLEHRLARGAGDMAAFFSPVKRMSVGAHGIPSSLAFERDTKSRDGGGLDGAFVHVLWRSGELGKRPVFAGWSVELPENLDYLWNVIPGGQVDPAVLVQYAKIGFETDQARVLWDYKLSLSGSTNSYFVLSQVPKSISAALNGSAVFSGQDVALKIIRELAEVGLAIGGESLRSGSKALGVIGLVAAIRLLGGTTAIKGAFKNDSLGRGFLLPVDSFKELLGAGLETAEGFDGRYADLIALQLTMGNDERLVVSFAAVECKYCSGTFSDGDASAALEQAARTYERLFEVADTARSPSGIPERLALLELISFGLRLNPATNDEVLSVEQLMLQRLLDGEFDIAVPNPKTIVVITECQGRTASWASQGGLVVRLAPGHWPGISDSEAVQSVAGRVAEIFSSVKSALVSLPEPGSVSASSTPEDRVSPQTTLPTNAQVETAAVSTEGIAQPEDSKHVAPPGDTLGRLAPILVGTDEGRRQVLYDPQSEKRPLENYNMMITGSSGKGKTQLVKTLIAELRRQKRNVLILDFKNDFATDIGFLTLSALSCRYITFEGLPYNPLIPMPITHPQTKQAVLQISQHISGIASVLAKTFGLGAQQEASLKEAVRDAYRDRGFDPVGNVRYNPDADFPDFNDVGEKLRVSNPTAYSRMDPLFDLGVFQSASRGKTFEAMLQGASVVDLSQIQSDAIKNAIAKIVILSAHAYYNARPHSGVLRQFFVFDEAHRVLDTEFLVKFVRECRAYGVGVLLSSQNPSDFPAETSASLNTKILHGNGTEKERVRDILATLGATVEESVIAQMGLFDAYVSSPHYSATRFRTLSYPHYLVLEAIRRKPNVARQVLQVEGVVTERLSIGYLLAGLLEMGLVVETGNGLQARSG